MNSFKAGSQKTHFWEKDFEYQSFSPSLINRNFVIKDQGIFPMLEEATRLLGELNVYSTLVPDVDYFIQMHVKSEAVSSSKIEGTKTGIDEALLPEDEIDPEHRDDWLEVQNYIKALNASIEELDRIPVSKRLIKKTHKTLMHGVRGEHKRPGSFRETQNWIGGSSIRTAHFIPPHDDEVLDLMSDWEKFWHNRSISAPVLIRVAIGHYQFETIHPFLDGNGRIGRLLITLQLIEKGFLSKPVLYLSNYFEENRQAYYDSLDSVRNKDDLEQWIRFFLEGIISTAKKGQSTFREIVSLRTRYEQKIVKLGRKAARARKLMLALFSDPIVSVNDVSKIVEINYDPANNLVKDFEKLGILEEITGYSRNRLFRMSEYVNLFR